MECLDLIVTQRRIRRSPSSPVANPFSCSLMSDMVEVAVPLLGGDEAVAGRRLGSAGCAKCSTKAAPKSSWAAVAGREAVGRFGEVVGERRAARPCGRPPAGRPAAAVRGRSSMPQMAAPRNMARQWWGLDVGPRDAQLEPRRARGRRPPPGARSCSRRDPRSPWPGPSCRARSAGTSWGRGRPWPGARAAASRRRRRPSRRPWRGRRAPRRARASPSRRTGSDRLGWPPEAGEPRPQLGHEGGPAARAGEVGLGVQLGQGGGVGRAQRGLGGGGDLEAAGSELGAEVVDGHGARLSVSTSRPGPLPRWPWSGRTSSGCPP